VLPFLNEREERSGYFPTACRKIINCYEDPKIYGCGADSSFYSKGSGTFPP